MKARVYAISSEGTPIIEILNGPKKGAQNSCYELPHRNKNYCDDNSDSLTPLYLSVDPDPRLHSEPMLGKIAPIEKSIELPKPYTCASARLIDSGKDSLKADFNLGQHLLAKGVRYQMPFAGSSESLQWQWGFFWKTIPFDSCDIEPNDIVELYGYETVGRDDLAVVKIYNSDRSKKHTLSFYYVYLERDKIILDQ